MAAWYMFQFHRILQYARPPSGSEQPFFWMFVDNLLMTEDDQVTADRFLQVGAPGGEAQPDSSSGVLGEGTLTPEASATLVWAGPRGNQGPWTQTADFQDTGPSRDSLEGQPHLPPSPPLCMQVTATQIHVLHT